MEGEPLGQSLTTTEKREERAERRRESREEEEWGGPKTELRLRERDRPSTSSTNDTKHFFFQTHRQYQEGIDQTIKGDRDQEKWKDVATSGRSLHLVFAEEVRSSLEQE
jgi:hypothetical protein